MSGLKIYKASAGSGKTFRLTGQYLLMLFSNPFLYRHVLAVTFTNKATGEMKQRILEELNLLAKGRASKHYASLSRQLKLNEHEIRQKASRILTFILHDYSRFSVSTIDHFFQRVIRAFAREIGLQSGYTLETDESEVLNYVIDELLLATEKDDQLRSWLVDFAQTRMMEEKSWNFRDEIMSLAEELTREDVKDLRVNQKVDRQTLSKYVKFLKQEQAQFEKAMKGFGHEAVGIMEKSGLMMDHFNRKKSGVARYFYYLKEGRKDKLIPNPTVLKVLDEPDKWPAGKLDKETEQLVISVAGDQLNPILKQAVEYSGAHYQKYQSAKEIQKNIYVLGILGDIQKRLYVYCREKNLFLISDAADFLRDIISGNDAPFVYERTGSIYHHFMIDEFQDTSRFQWENFKPLIMNSLSQNLENLIVGDVKQSIYRWRNSDWKILEDEVEKDFARYSIEQENLIYNRRSLRNIIAYNNTIFYYARYVLQKQFDMQYETGGRENPWEDKLLNAYNDVMQKLPEKRDGGYVLNRFYPHFHQQEPDIREKIKERLIKDIEYLQDKQYNLSDIAVIVRKNREGQEIADALMEYRNSGHAPDKYRYDVISNDSLYIHRAESVKFILALFRYLVHPNDDINRAFIKDVYYSTILKEEPAPSKGHQLFSLSPEDFPGHLPVEFTKSLPELKRMPLYDLTERLIHIFGIHKIEGEIPYIQAFQEILLDFSRRYASDLNTFLDWWHENGRKQKLQLPEDYDAIRIITIHKVKGLEFRVVLVPFCNWELDTTSSGMKRNYLWCSPADEDFREIGVVPVNYSNKLTDTIFKEHYYSEKFHNYVDNLNLLYVTLTRAEEMLICYAPIKVKKDGTLNYLANEKGISTVGELIHYVYENHESLPLPDDSEYPFIDRLKDWWNDRELTLDWGQLEGAGEQERKQDNQLLIEDYPVYSAKPSLHLRYEHSQFFSDKPDLFQGTVDYGKVMHQVFENIHSLTDVESALNKLYFEGKITWDEKQELKERIENLINSSNVSDWFSGSWQVSTEREILLPNGRTYRPDRVMTRDEQTVVVDYKFGERHSKQYENKIRNYLREINKMGYSNPVGYIWYVNQNALTNVKL